MKLRIWKNLETKERTNVPGWLGSIGIALWVWYWDANHETISKWHWEHPKLTMFVFTWVWAHMVLKKPQRILIRW